MNAVVPMTPPQAAIAPAALVPANMSEAIQLAEMMATAKLVPLALQKSPADCLMVIQQAVRWQMDPFAVAQECSVIQGKLMHSGKLTLAVINSRGNLRERLRFEYSGDGDNRAVTVTGMLQGEGEPRAVLVRIKDAKTNNRVWQTQPDQQLAYHGARVWARRHTPELMLGVWSPEEFDEATGPQPSMRDVTPPKPAIAAPVTIEPPHDPETGEIAPHKITLPTRNGTGLTDWLAFGGTIIAGFKSAGSLADLADWQHLNIDALNEMVEKAPKAHGSVTKALDAMREKLATPEPNMLSAEDADSVLTA